MTRAILLLPLLAACQNDIGLARDARCDGQLQGNEDTVDQPFDVDQDGFFDAANPDCAATYGAGFLDCDDADPDVNPHAAEVECDGLDNDCTADTPDGDDVDADGYTACEDCADAEPAVNPGTVEIGCNGVDDDCDEATPDGDDADGDGAAACLDCNDSDASVGPNATETTCNGVDDDCDETTLDGEDGDGDGWTLCAPSPDCDDTNPDVHPSGTEVCDNDLDDDCNGDIDDGCVSGYSDTWDLDSTLSYQCIWGLITIDFDKVLIDEASPDISITQIGGTQPGEMTGTFSSSTEFSVERYVAGSCAETYTLEGTFTSMNTFEGTFTAAFRGSSAACFDCTTQSWTVSGSR